MCLTGLTMFLLILCAKSQKPFARENTCRNTICRYTKYTVLHKISRLLSTKMWEPELEPKCAVGKPSGLTLADSVTRFSTESQGPFVTENTYTNIIYRQNIDTVSHKILSLFLYKWWNPCSFETFGTWIQLNLD